MHNTSTSGRVPGPHRGQCLPHDLPHDLHPDRREALHRHGGFGGLGFDLPPFPGGRMGRRGGGRGGRRTDRGDIRSAILAMVAEQPRHGYEIIQAIEERSGGNWRPSPGSIYPTVAQLEDEGLVDTEKVEGRRMVTLTAAGTAYVDEHRAEMDAVWDKAGESVDEPTQQLRSEVSQLIAAVRQVAGIGSPDQVKAAADAMADARKTMYRLLAE